MKLRKPVASLMISAMEIQLVKRIHLQCCDGNNSGLPLSPSLGRVLSPSVDENNIDGGIMDSLSDQSGREKQLEPLLVGVRGESTPTEEKRQEINSKRRRQYEEQVSTLLLFIC